MFSGEFGLQSVLQAAPCYTARERVGQAESGAGRGCGNW